ncbi:hypothetical protein J4206_06560 [Candidatus Woesearchaeota archaeon]|nr:hypothetical protein [Candidatus Woesearchaeota archaeon]
MRAHNKNRNAKIAFVIAVAFIIAVNLSIITYAAFTDRIWDAVEKMYDFESRYEKNPKIWDFLLFSTIFNIIAWIGLVKAFPDNKVAAYILALVIGIALGLGAVKGDLNVKFFVPFVKNIFFFIVMGIIFFVLIKFDMNKFLALILALVITFVNKFLAFILALVITFVAFNVLGLFGAIDTDGIGGILSRSAKYDTLEQINARFKSIALTHDVEGFDVNDGVAAKAAKIKSKLNEEIAALEVKLIENPKDTITKEKLKMLNKVLYEIEELEKKGIALEKKEEEELLAKILKDYSKYRVRVEEIKKMTADSAENVKKKFDEIHKLWVEIKAEEEKNKPESKSPDAGSEGSKTAETEADTTPEGVIADPIPTPETRLV